jgi:hypothetical protein
MSVSLWKGTLLLGKWCPCGAGDVGTGELLINFSVILNTEVTKATLKNKCGQWLTPVILATQETEVRRTVV